MYYSQQKEHFFKNKTAAYLVFLVGRYRSSMVTCIFLTAYSTSASVLNKNDL